MTTPNQNLLPVRRATDNYTLTEVEKVGTWIARSGMFGCTKPEQGQVIAIACREKGMNLFEFLDRYHVMFDGRIKLKSHAVFAEFRKSGGKIKWIKTGDDGKSAEADVTFEGQTVRLSFTIEQAAAQGLVKKDSAWTKTPGNMLRARLITNAIGMLCPEIYLSGGDDDAAPVPAKIDMCDLQMPTIIVESAPSAEPVAVWLEKKKASEAVAMAIADGKATPDDIDPELMPVTAPDTDPVVKPETVLPEAIIKQLAKLIGHIEPEAVAFCQSINWLKQGETMANLSVGNARYIIGKHEAFIAKAKAFAETK